MSLQALNRSASYATTAILHFPIQPNGWHMLKRVTDVLLASLALLMLSPVLLVIAAVLAVTSPGPIIYKSLRIGKDYKPFHMYKFRTMRVDADQQRDALRQAVGLQGQLFKIKEDPRVTPVGKLLRSTSLDELPQLLNVLKGDMSLVGPRPLPPDESEMFVSPYTMRFSVYPGITGLWQIKGRSNNDFQFLCKLEYSYIRNWSFWKDLEIMFQTIPAVLAKRGAC